MSNAADRLILPVENLSINQVWLVFNTEKRVVLGFVYCHSLFLQNRVIPQPALISPTTRVLLEWLISLAFKIFCKDSI